MDLLKQAFNSRDARKIITWDRLADWVKDHESEGEKAEETILAAKKAKVERVKFPKGYPYKAQKIVRQIRDEMT